MSLMPRSRAETAAELAPRGTRTAFAAACFSTVVVARSRVYRTSLYVALVATATLLLMLR